MPEHLGRDAGEEGASTAVSSTAAGTHHTILHLPSPIASVRHSLPALLEGVVAPFAFFYVFLLLTGFRGALVAGLVWGYVALGFRLVRKERPSATLILGTALLTVRSVISFATGSALVYFVQPAAATAMVAVLFGVSAMAGRPIIERLALDFCPLDPGVMGRPSVRRFFVQISLLWTVVLLANAGFVLWLLVTSSLHAFVIERALVNWTLTGIGTAVSVVWFLHSMRRAGIAVRWGRAPAPASAA
ncbi:MAG TPA: VC0807 family protein [Acidimicrobiales bacterium]|nr:VC0807 family protein [Acidimicrobiales bacterium]